jgi:Zn-dependent alcohol dehydrogenase
LGATHVIDTSGFKDTATDLPAALRDIAPKGVNAVIETTGVVPLISAVVPALHAKGQIILIGIVTGKMMELNLAALMTVRLRPKIVTFTLTS